jgi:hypothetical protein
MQRRGPASATRIYGIDFTSAPRARKLIAIAAGTLIGRVFTLEAIERCADFAQFDAFLARPGPWIAGLDAPLGLPREAIVDLAWPRTWPALVRHCAALGRDGFRAALDRYRESRPVGNRYAHRLTDHPAGSHSPLKLVNPPVGLMFLEAAPRLLAANVTIPGLHRGDPTRVAVEAYPGYAARRIDARSYKSDEVAKQTPARRLVRHALVEALTDTGNEFGVRLTASSRLLRALTSDASGDSLDAAIAALQAAWCVARRERRFGLPAHIDPLEGWIAMVPTATIR